MPKFTVACYKPINDVLRQFVEVEAETTEQAIELAIQESIGNDNWDWWQCSEDSGQITGEVITKEETNTQVT